MTQSDIVYFLNADGTYFSNDVRWHAAKAAGDLAEDGRLRGDSEGVESTGYADMDAKALKAEVASRNEGRDEESQLSIKGLTKKSELVALLEADDEAQAQAASDENIDESSDQSE